MDITISFISLFLMRTSIPTTTGPFIKSRSIGNQLTSRCPAFCWPSLFQGNALEYLGKEVDCRPSQQAILLKYYLSPETGKETEDLWSLDHPHGEMLMRKLACVASWGWPQAPETVTPQECYHHLEKTKEVTRGMSSVGLGRTVKNRCYRTR